MKVEQPSRSSQLSAAMLRWFDEHSSDGVLTTDASLVIQSVNQSLAAAIGRPAAAVIGKALLDVFPSLAERGLSQHYAAALRGEVTVLSHTLHKFVFPAAGPNGGQALQSARIAPLYDGAGIVGTITVVEDVSERVASERELRAQIVRAEAARSTAETASRVKDEFLATLSHEIRTPLNAVLGWTRILLSRDELDMQMVKRAIDVIDRNASAQLTLITDMLDTARIAAGKVRLEMAAVDLAAVVRAALDVVRPAADSKGVTLITDFAEALPPVYGDADRLQQVVWNLLSNAVKFTDKNGSVTIGLALHGEATRLTVSDTGPGIAPAFLPQVFERFKQGDASASRCHGGLGLGLSLVKDLVALHGGTVSVDSSPEGTMFTVLLPGRAEKAGVEAPVRRARGAAADLSGVRILVVEDDPDALEIVIRMMSDAGASVVAAGSTGEALAKLQTPAERPDVVVTDIGMPARDGYSFLEELRTLPADRGGTAPVIAVTAYATAEDRKKALSAGFEAHLSKPFSPKLLVTTIARIVGTRV